MPRAARATRPTRSPRSRRAVHVAGGRAPAHDRDTETRILDAAHAVFVRTGTAGARTQEIADQAGVNKALLHYYFRSKELLAEAVFKRAVSALLPGIIEVLASKELALEDKIERVIRLEFEHLSRSPFLPGYVLGEINQHPERAHQLIATFTGMRPEGFRRRVLGTLKRQIDEGVRAGTLRPIAPDQLVVNLLSLCVYPFAARPLLMAMFDLEGEEFLRFMARRRRGLGSFLLGALRP